MGVIGHVQFMNLCSAGDTGTPPETAQMSEGLAWANLQLDPPWTPAKGSNANSSANATALTSTSQRRLLDDGTADSGGGDDDDFSSVGLLSADTEGSFQEKKVDSRTKLEGGVSTSVFVLVLQAVVHWLGLHVFEYCTGVAQTSLPGAVQMPG